jgi:hypothetical protein
LASTEQLAPSDLNKDSEAPVQPDADGKYAIAIPGM